MRVPLGLSGLDCVTEMTTNTTTAPDLQVVPLNVFFFVLEERVLPVGAPPALSLVRFQHYLNFPAAGGICFDEAF